jgi:hypothetical protein
VVVHLKGLEDGLLNVDKVTIIPLAEGLLLPTFHTSNSIGNPLASLGI